MKKEMKIALVNPRVESYSGVLPPLGLLYLAACLEKENYQVAVFDLHPNNDRKLNELAAYQPDIVGMTVLTDYWPRAKYAADFIRKKIQTALFVVGGIHITTKPEESLNILNADIGVIGEGEKTMLELCRRLTEKADWANVAGIIYKDRAGISVRTAPRPFIENLDEIPFPARHLLRFEEYLVPPGIIRGHWSKRSTSIITSRGCPFQCIWCASHCIFGKKVRRRSVSNVIAELEQLINRYKIDTVWFVDDTFTLNPKWVCEFSQELINRKIKLVWGCQAHIATAEKEMFTLMKKAGLIQLDFGVESGSDKVLKALKKTSDRESIKKAFRVTKEIGIRTLATFMFGLPSENREDIEATMKLAREIQPDFASSFFLTPYPGTELMAMVEANQWNLHYDPSTTGLKKTPPLTINFTEKQLQKFRARFQKMFIYRNFLRNLLTPEIMLKGSFLVFQYPVGLFLGIKKFLKTFVLDDLFFEFLVYETIPECPAL